MDLILMDETFSHAAAWRLLHGRGFSLSPEGSPLYSAWCAVWQVIAGGDLVVAYFAQWLATDLLLSLAVFAFLADRGCESHRCRERGGAVVVTGRRGQGLAARLLLRGIRGPVRSGDPGAHPATRSARGPGAGDAREARVRGAAYGFRHGSRAPWTAAGLACGRRVTGRGRGARGGLATSSRLWTAFSQHYAWAVALETPGTIIDHWREHERVTAQAFPGANSVLEALRVNPRELVRHVSANAGRAIAVVADALVDSQVEGLNRALVFLVMLAAVLPLAGEASAGDPKIAATLALLSLISVPSLFALPKGVYCLPVLLLGVVGFLRLAATVISAAARALPPVIRDSTVIVAAVSALFVCWHASPRPANQPNLEALGLLRRAHAQEGRPPWRLLEADGGWCVYVGLDRCETVMLHELPPEGWRATLARSEANAVLVGPYWASARTVAQDPDFQRFAREPQEFGFRLVFTTAERGFFRRTEP